MHYILGQHSKTELCLERYGVEEPLWSRAFTTYALFLKKETHANLGTNMKKFFLNCTFIAIKEGIRYSKKCTELHGIARNCTEFHGILRNCAEFHKIARNCAEFHNIEQNCTEYQLFLHNIILTGRLFMAPYTIIYGTLNVYLWHLKRLFMAP